MRVDTRRTGRPTGMPSERRTSACVSLHRNRRRRLYIRRNSVRRICS